MGNARGAAGGGAPSAGGGPRVDENLPRVIAHRGNSSEAPENTLAAFEAALAAGADAIEVDLQPTSDGVAVVIHDDRLDRTTDLVGEVGQTDAATIASADAGSWFANPFAGIRVPTFDDLIAWGRANPGIHWLLEFKGRWNGALLAPELEKLRAAGMVSRAVVQSFDVETVRALSAVGPDFRRELLVAELPGVPAVREWMTGAEVDAAQSALASVDPEMVRQGIGQLLELLREVGAVGCNPHGMLPVEHPALVSALHAEGFTLSVWTIDEPAHWQLAVEAGVDAIITNRPLELATWLAREVAAV
ncbi:glycerophosphodiester phosphodiesterase [Subtercola boreus]|uniref:GP-PDE domain-containing protein n=1 Tax=Subtercola boreus TaxID=120213 RepID=A0A3E0WEF3_9MICO|nr:glycerophosphodiester phosphodiesterase family protein [Subtercola boreus]RFA23602.1 hypothetical protein B7R24_01625 [Subtercola boreus]RFA23996.1 hypothetical protein B7R23_01625 [Subtercola boreus]RFA29694.1 hypothetical protein B7R25_01620 [Subtercola boreus]